MTVNHAALVQYTPYVNAWSGEQHQPATVIERPGVGIAYADETLYDRDRHGVLWQRVAVNQGVGEPKFGEVHPMRQRRAMRRLLCGVCADPADRSDDGVLWLLRDYRGDWPDWPNRMGVDEPPVCVGCARRASRMCPELRKGAVAIRARRYPIAGVRGLLYRTAGTRPPVITGFHNVAYGDAAARWIQAVKILRKLGDCRVLSLDELCRT